MVKNSTAVMGILIVVSILFVAESKAGRKSPGNDIMIIVFTYLLILNLILSQYEFHYTDTSKSRNTIITVLQYRR